MRKVGDRVRVTVQLIDAQTDRHVWAERYDRKLEDIFAIQDEVTASDRRTLPGRVEAATQERAKRKPTDNMAAYEYVLAAKVLHHRSQREANAEALASARPRHRARPEIRARPCLEGLRAGPDLDLRLVRRSRRHLQQVTDELQIALALDDNDSDVHRILAAVNLTRNDHDKAAYHQERALALNPNYDLVVVQQGEFLTWLGRPEEGIDWIRKAMRLNPYHPERFWNHLGRALLLRARNTPKPPRRSRGSRGPTSRITPSSPPSSRRWATALRAAAHAAEAVKLEPGFSVAAYLATQHYKQEADRARHEAGLLKAGLPA